MQVGPISFVIPCFNSAATIEACLDSVLLSATSQDEIIICNNASSDLTTQICQRLLLNSPIPYRIISKKTNVGPVKNWLYGISESKHEWCKLVFSDDELLHQEFRLFRLSDIPDDCEGLFASSFIQTSSSNRLAYDIRYPTGMITSEDFKRELLSWRLPFSPTAMLFRKSYAVHVLQSQILVVNEEVLQNGAGPDYALYLSAGLRGKLFYYKNPIARMNVSSQSITIRHGPEALRRQYFSAALHYLHLSSHSDDLRYLMFRESLREKVKERNFFSILLVLLKSPGGFLRLMAFMVFKG